MNKREVPTKNYVILLLISVFTIVLTLYINAWVNTYKSNKLSVSPLDGVVEEVNINEINVTFSEMNEVLLYISYTNNKKIYNAEEKILKYIKGHDLVDKFIYVNVLDYLENKEYLKILKETFVEVKDNIEDAPMLIYVKNGKAEKVINRKNSTISTYDISELIKEYKLNN